MTKTVLKLFGLIGWLSLGIYAQSAPCITPTRHNGICVPLKHCQNIRDILLLNKKYNNISSGVFNYIRKSVCHLPGVATAVCCQMTELDETVNKLIMEKNSLPKNCGIAVTERISNGQKTAVFEYPWMALLRYKDFDGDIVDACGGSLIHERYVLTAAHCLNDRKFELDHVRLGEHDKNTELDCVEEGYCAGPVQDIPIESAIAHPHYNNPKYTNDIGLIKLARNVKFEDHIRPICLPFTAETRHLLHDKYILTGWGKTEKNVLSSVLLQATLPRIDNAQCEKVISNRVVGSSLSLTDNQLCAGGTHLTDSCRGDSGGPLGTIGTLYNEPRFIQYGIVSVGVDTCGKYNVPSIYTRVSGYMNWIIDNIKPS